MDTGLLPGLFRLAEALVKRGQERFEKQDFKAALGDFEAALTYPEDLCVGRSEWAEEAAAQYWKGKCLEALDRLDEARTSWQKGADGAEGSADQNRYRKMCADAIRTLQ